MSGLRGKPPNASGEARVVLVLEDSEDDLLMVRKSLPEQTLIAVPSIAEADHALRSEASIDVILTDLNVHDSWGLDTFYCIHAAARGIPIIVMSGYSEDDLAIQAVRDGAQDFIRKDDITGSRLQLEVDLAIERARLTKELEAARNQARRESEFKSEFLTHFSHEIRTPLNAVIGCASLLKETRLGDEQRDLLTGLTKGGNRLLALINDILDISKIGAGQFEPELEKFDLRDLIRDTMMVFSCVTEQRGVVLGSQIDPEIPTLITSDARRIKQILLNLVGNAVKFTSRGRIVISAGMEDDGLIRFGIADTGRGLSAEQSAKIFAPFMQAEKADMNIGTGLGLVVCKSLAQALGGTIGVTSDLDVGSEFWFTIRPTAAEKSQAERTALESVWAVIYTQNIHIRETVQGHLQSRGVRTTSVSSERALVELVRQARPDILMIDKASSRDWQRSGALPALRGVPIVTIDGSSEGICESGALHHARTLQVVASALGEHPLDQQKAEESNVVDLKSFRFKKALVVDDDPLNRRVISKMLQRVGIDPTCVADGRQAVESLEGGHEFEVVFMDCSMPEMDGFEATRQVRRRGSRVTIVALTAHAFESDIQRCLDAGMDLFLAKPIRQEDVDETLAQVLKRRIG